MTYALGDPAHINLGHNELLALIQEQADRFMVTVTLPDTAGLGDTGHVDDHNLIVAALQDIADAPAGLEAPTITGTTGSPSTGTGLDGKALYTWTGNGSFTTSTDGWVRVHCQSGGVGAGGSIATAGSGGAFDDVVVFLPAGTYTVTVGAGGSFGSGNGGTTTLTGPNGFVLGLNRPVSNNLGNDSRSADATGRYTDITGTSVGYAGAGYSSTNAATFNAAFGGCPNSATVARANSGGGGSYAGSTGVGAAGILQLLV